MHDPRMWRYWRGKYGTAGAVDYYPDAPAGVREALARMLAERGTIDRLMAQAAAEAERTAPDGSGCCDWWTEVLEDAHAG